MSQNKRNSISSKPSEDHEFRTSSNTVYLPKQVRISPINTEILRRETSLQASSHLSQIDILNNQKSILSSLKKIQNTENCNQSNKGSIYSRYSKNRDSVMHLFSLIKPEPSRSTIFRSKTETDHNSRKDSIKDYLTNEQLIDIAINILHKPISYRNSHDIKMLVRSTENIAFFQTMIRQDDRETHEQCCRYMIYKAFPTESIVFQEGSIGTTFYIILKGSVSVYISNQKPTLINDNVNNNNIKNKNKKNELKTKGTMRGDIDSSLLQHEKNNLNENPEEQPSLDFLELRKVRVLTSGASFGELALMEKKPRAATIKCDSECHFAVLEKDHFNSILKEKEEKNLFQQIEFLYALKLFSSWSYHSVKKLFLSMDQIEFQKNKTVYHEHESPENMYIIKSGEFKVTKLLVFSKKADTLEQEIKSLEYSSGNYALSCLKNPMLITKTLEVAILQKGEYFGEEELIRSEKRKTTITCSSSSGVLYVLSKEEFMKRLYNDENTYTVLLEQIAWRKQFFFSRIKKFVKTAREMQEKVERKKGENGESQGGAKESEFIIQKNPLLEKKPVKTQIRRKNFCESMIHPEDVVKILQNSEKMRTLGFGMGTNSPKQNFFMLKAFAQYQEREKEKELSAEKTKKKQQISQISSPKQEKKEHGFEKTQFHRKAMTFSTNSLINMPLENERIVDFLKNADLKPFATPKERSFNLKLRGWTSGIVETKESNRLKTTETFFEESSKEVSKEKWGDLPLKYQSESLKSSRAKISLKRYLQCSPTNTQFFKTVSCFSQNN